MSMENQELEKAKARIKLKQALLFEKRLDDFLRLEDPSTNQTIRKEIFDKLLGEVSLEDLEDELKSNNITLPEEEEFN